MSTHYFKDVSSLKQLDVYRVIQLFGVTDPCVQHAIKKLLRAGGRGSKGEEQDICEACARRADEASKIGTAPFLNRKKVNV